MTRQHELLLKVGLFGLSDLRRLAPIGDIGYLNAISYYKDYERSGLIDDIMQAFSEQRQKHLWTVECYRTFSYRNTDNTYLCPQLGLMWSIDSGD